MQEQELVPTIDSAPYPSLKLKTNVTIPPCTLAVWPLPGTIDSDNMGQLCENQVGVDLQDKSQNLHVIPMVHRIDGIIPGMVPVAAINLGDEEIRLNRMEDFGYLAPVQLDVSEISTTTAQEAPTDKAYATKEEDPKENEPYSSFITSPANVEGPRRGNLQDFEVTDLEKGKFQDLCREFSDVFSSDSKDIGCTPFIKMVIDTRDSPPVCQRPYILPLKHAEWVKHELNILEAAGVIVHSVSPWASPIVVVPKRSAPGEPR